MHKRTFLGLAALLAASLAGTQAAAQDRPFKVGLILPMSGPFAAVGRQINAAVRLYLAQNGDTVAGRKVEVILKDDGAIPSNSKRLAQELVVSDKVDVLAGFALTPCALAAASIATQARTPLVVMSAAASGITEASPFIVRTSFTVAQVSVPLADWAAKNGIRKVVTLVTDYAPGIDAERSFKDRFEAVGGTIVETVRVPLHGPDFSPFMQKVRDLKPDALFIFVPAPEGPALVKQFRQRGLDKAGIRLIGTGDVVDDDTLNAMGDDALGIITSHHYSAGHKSAANEAFIRAFSKANPGLRPNFMAAGGYDGTHLIFNALKKTAGAGGGEALIAAMRGQTFESPRGPIAIDARTRDIVQDVYIRRVEKVNGELYNVEFDTVKGVADPGKGK